MAYVTAAQIYGRPTERIPTIEELPTYREIQSRCDSVYKGMELGGAPVEVGGESPLQRDLQ
jgi:hypothetical protein